MKHLSRSLASAALAASVVLIASIASAALRGGPPIPTTLVLSKPAPDQIYGDQPVILMGVNTKTYKFILKDAYVDDPFGIVHWIDVWQYVKQYKPNFVVQGLDENIFEKFQPGQTLTVKGMFAPTNRTFEVQGTQVEGGTYSAPKTY
ncbi:MAG TPA: hypothetical protein VIX59_08215 [Candidatus Binataceae bacterium]|jgi:hypothetical protein